MIEREKLIPFLAPLLRQFRDARQPGESFGDFCHRLGPQQVETLRPA